MQFPTFTCDGDFLDARLRLSTAGAGEQCTDRLQVGPVQRGQCRLADAVPIQIEQSGGGAVDGADGPRRVNRDHARRDSLENGFDIAAPPLHFLVLPFELHRGPFNLSPARRELTGHGVERDHERAELVVALRLDALVQPAGADLARRRRETLDRSGNAFRHVQTHPRGADQNHQRDHEEEREVHARERPAQDPQLVVLLERLRHSARAGRVVTGQIVGCDYDADGVAVTCMDDGGSVQEIAGCGKGLDRIGLRPAVERLGRQPVGRRGIVAGPQCRYGHVHHSIEARQRSIRWRRSVDFDHLNPLLRDVGREQFANRAHV